MADDPGDDQPPEAVEDGEKEAATASGSSHKPPDGGSSVEAEDQNKEEKPGETQTSTETLAKGEPSDSKIEPKPEVTESKTALAESADQPEVTESKKALAESADQPEVTESKKALAETAEEPSKVKSQTDLLSEMDEEEATEEEFEEEEEEEEEATEEEYEEEATEEEYEEEAMAEEFEEEAMEEELEEETIDVAIAGELAEEAKSPSQEEIETPVPKPQSPKESVSKLRRSLSDFTMRPPEFDVESYDEEEEEEEEEEEMEPPIPYREILIQEYKAAKAEQKKLHDLNRKLQHKLSVILSKKERELTVLTEDETAELEMQYVSLMASLDQMRMQQEQLKEHRMHETEELKQESQEEQAAAEAQLTKLLGYRKNAATGGIWNKQSSRYKRAEQYFHTEREKWMEASRITLENILIKEEYDKVMKILKEREKVAEGLNMADFEQLKIENQSCNEKIEETNETIGQVRHKLREATQRLTHVKQKLHFVNIETRQAREALEEVEERVLIRRQILHSTKIARDRLKRNSKVLKQKSALLCFPELLCDYRKKLDEIDELRTKLAELKISHKDMTKEIRNFRYKIEDFKSSA